MKRPITFFLAFTFLTGLTNTLRAESDPKVAVSIRPLHSIVAAVMGNTGSPQLILANQASPHDAALKPSQVKEVQQADMVFWIGPALEGFLDKTIDALPVGKSVALIEVESIKTLPLSTAKKKEEKEEHEHKEGEHDEDEHKEGKHEEDEHADHDHDKEHDHEKGHDDDHKKADAHEEKHEDDHDEGHGHAHSGTIDPHLWLDLKNASAIAKVVAGRLAKLSPENAATYQANVAKFVATATKLDGEIKQQLKSVSTEPFITLHDGLQYFGQAYKLNSKGAVFLEHEQTPSAKRIRELQALVKKENIDCVFTEPFSSPKMPELLGTKRNISLDILGLNITPGPDHYFETVRRVSANVATCLTDQ